ncbi:MAG: arginyl-tRNA--protein-N-Asp/Glu arginylyltransferase [Candidatus Azotimanducaceae bacterium]|jgi:arginyl-tRNA--protein-N-Asp/Glu arginylyltransferase
MNDNVTHRLANMHFFTTPAHDCSYLADRQAITLFADPHADIDTALYSALSAVGFRRSGAHIYRPHCQACQACIPVRVVVNDHQMNRRQKRIWRKNLDLDVTVKAPSLTNEYFELFERYIRVRHSDGDMFPADREQFQSFLVNGRVEARFVEFRLAGRLIAVAVMDILDSALSAIYTFFEPEENQRSLGTHAILWQLEESRRAMKSWLYLGYWIDECQKMNYKNEYTPQERYIDNCWQRHPEK